jgi:hypothetical protein
VICEKPTPYSWETVKQAKRTRESALETQFGVRDASIGRKGLEPTWERREQLANARIALQK